MNLDAYRAEIDHLDTELVQAFRRRMEVAGEIAAYKRENSLPVLDASRERAVLSKVSQLAGDAYAPYIRTLYATLFDVSRAYQHTQMEAEGPLAQILQKALAESPALFPTQATVACQGIEGAYAQQACEKLFPHPDIVYCRSFDAVCQAVLSGMCAFGVLPIENSTYGPVGAVHDALQRYPLSIVRTTRLHIDHALLARPGARMENIWEVISHEQALGQCASYLAAHPSITATVCENTAVAAQLVAQSGRDDLAAISSRHCAGLYGLTPLASGIADSANNYTRFVCIARDLAIYPGADHISLLISTPHKPGALYRVLARFAALGLNMTRLESRPIPGSDFEFLFHLDIQASVQLPLVQQLLDELSTEGVLLRLLGCYSEA